MSRDRVAQDVVEVLTAFATADIHVAESQYVVEALQAYTAGSTPSGSFGVATSQNVVEVLIGAAIDARIQQYVVEALFQDNIEGGGTGGAHSFAYAV